MSPDIDDNSPFSRFKKDPAPAKAAARPAAAEERVEALDNALRALRADFAAYKARPVPPVPVDARVAPLEAALRDQRAEFEAALRDLKADFEAYKARPLPPPGWLASPTASIPCSMCWACRIFRGRTK